MALICKYTYIPDLYTNVFVILLIPAFVITVFSLLPYIPYYLRINRINKNATGNFSKNNKIIYRTAIITILLLILACFMR